MSALQLLLLQIAKSLPLIVLLQRAASGLSSRSLASTSAAHASLSISAWRGQGSFPAPAVRRRSASWARVRVTAGLQRPYSLG